MPCRSFCWIALTTMVALAAGKSAVAQDCDPLKPARPVETDLANQTKANANVLLKSLGSGEFENNYRRIERDLSAKYPNADQVHFWEGMIYMLCTLIKSSNATNEEKFAQFNLLVDKWQKQPPGDRSGPEANRPQVGQSTDSGTRNAAAATATVAENRLKVQFRALRINKDSKTISALFLFENVSEQPLDIVYLGDRSNYLIDEAGNRFAGDLNTFRVVIGPGQRVPVSLRYAMPSPPQGKLFLSAGMSMNGGMPFTFGFEDLAAL